MKKLMVWFSLSALLLITAIPVAEASFIPTASADSIETVTTLADLEEKISYLFPSKNYLSDLQYHSTWSEVDRGLLSETSGIEVTYEASFNAAPEHDDELPTINAYIIPMASQDAAEAQFNAWSNSSNFKDRTWIKRTSGADYFSYYTDSTDNNDLIKDRILEEGSLHLVSYYDNVIIVVNFYRTSGEYLKSNVTAYITYLENYEETLSILNELVVYVEEALLFYTGTTFSVEGPSDYDYYVDDADYSLNLSNTYAISQNGTFSFDLYIDDGSEVGTILDMSGVGNSITGAFTVGINENAVLQYSFYDPGTSSTCKDESGWHHLYSNDSVGLYEWQTITLGYGVTEELTLSVDGEEHDTCAVDTSRTSSLVYLGDYPNDSIEESFVGYIKDITVTYSTDSDGNLIDELAGNLIFLDVSELHEYGEAIGYLKDEGIISGYTDGTYRPDQEVNRVEILKMLLLGFGYSVKDDLTMPDLSDLEASAWYLPYLNYALDLGIVQGYGDGTYRPANSLNRVEFLKILTKAYGLNLNDYPVTDLYPDTGKDEWYSIYVQYSKDNNLMDTDEYGDFNPGNTVSRGEVAETIYRLIGS
ncbi:MAG: S-layer homology domain-containing protein [Candidatus Peregrinibacteria bacterium]|nr:S-layer homology domain-containing protein [Candidatus Peregrinibacteria bacterium]